MNDNIDDEALEELLDGVLVRRSMVSSGQAGVYQLHQLVREFLLDQVNCLPIDQKEAFAA